MPLVAGFILQLSARHETLLFCSGPDSDQVCVLATLGRVPLSRPQGGVSLVSATFCAVSGCSVHLGDWLSAVGCGEHDEA